MNRSTLVQPNIDSMALYVPGKPIEEVQRELGLAEIIKLASNESPLGPSPHVIERLAAAASEVHRYPDATVHALRQKLASELGVASDELTFGNGSNELISLICQTFAAPSEHAVIGVPSFVCYELGLKAAAVPFTAVPLREHVYWNADDLLSALKPQTKLLFIANPNNPTGTHLAASELERLVREVPEQVIIVVDEAYVEFADAPDYESAMSLRGHRERLIVLRTFSKSHGLAGLRVGYAVAPPEIGKYLNRVRAPFNVNTLAQHGALAALEDPQHVRNYVALNARERTKLIEALRARGLKVAPSQTNFVFVDFQRDSQTFHRLMLERGVIIRPMPQPVSTWQRVSIGLESENLKLLQALDSVL